VEKPYVNNVKIKGDGICNGKRFILPTRKKFGNWGGALSYFLGEFAISFL